MRTPQRKRPRIRIVMQTPENVSLRDIASKVRYAGSPEHKDTPSFAGQPRPRADASICSRSFADKQGNLTKRLRQAIRDGDIGEPWEGAFPRYVWAIIDGQCYEARLVNREKGEY